MNFVYLLVFMTLGSQPSGRGFDISVAPTSRGFITGKRIYAFQDGDIYHEDFEAGYLPPGWTLIDGNGDMWTWKVANVRDVRYLWGFIPPYAGDYILYYNDNDAGPGSEATVEGASVTVALPEDLSSLFLTFCWGLVQYCGYEMLFVTVNDDTVWEIHSTTRGIKTVDLSPYKDDSCITLTFYYDDGGGCWGWAGAFDNVELSEEPPIPPPAICCLYDQCGPYNYTEGLWIADLAYDERRDLFYEVVVKEGGSDVLIWDPRTCEYSVAYDSTTGISQRGIAYNPEEDVIYVGGWNQGILYTFEVPQGNEKLVLKDSWSIPNSALRKIAGLAWDDDEGGLFIQPNYESNVLGKVDPSTKTVLWVRNEDFYWGGRGYDGAGLSYSRDEHGLYAISMYDNSVNFFKNPEWDDCVADTFCYLMNPVGFGWGIGHREGEAAEYWVSTASLNSAKVYRGGCVINIGVTEKYQRASPFFIIEPTPVRDIAEITFEVPFSGRVELSLYDSRGRLADKLLDRYFDKGRYTFNFSKASLTSGIYFLQMKTEKGTFTKKIAVLR